MIPTSECHWLAFPCSSSLTTMIWYLAPICSVHYTPGDLTQSHSCDRSPSPMIQDVNPCTSPAPEFQDLAQWATSLYLPWDAWDSTMRLSPKHIPQLCPALPAASAASGLPLTQTTTPHHGLWCSLSQTVYLKCRDTLISASFKPSVYPSSCSLSPWLLLQFCHLWFNIGSLWELKWELESVTFPF